ncbi:MAG: hypothetical protein KC474_07835 [Cyanobacteria bacterium HKST-UBA04]|nr:hypothetical protein [Cyanobacteria bacterium HKST-UBA05]MCA9799447.1 hypothetical protein [Cyanobacteria bacterium HKST-UBA04]MCA9841410.1 hypothetical protein [Cyanobacteria bacterium HKST-UBA03]
MSSLNPALNHSFGQRPSPFTNPGLIESSHIIDGFRQALAQDPGRVLGHFHLPEKALQPLSGDTFTPRHSVLTTKPASNSPNFATLSPHYNPAPGSTLEAGLESVAPHAMASLWQGAQLLMGQNRNDAFDAWRTTLTATTTHLDPAEPPINLSA